jgi:hypothetical protein
LALVTSLVMAFSRIETRHLSYIKKVLKKGIQKLWLTWPFCTFTMQVGHTMKNNISKQNTGTELWCLKIPIYGNHTFILVNSMNKARVHNKTLNLRYNTTNVLQSWVILNRWSNVVISFIVEKASSHLANVKKRLNKL